MTKLIEALQARGLDGRAISPFTLHLCNSTNKLITIGGSLSLPFVTFSLFFFHDVAKHRSRAGAPASNRFYNTFGSQ